MSDWGKADCVYLTGIVEGMHTDLYVSDAFHKAFLEVCCFSSYLLMSLKLA